MTLLRDSLEKLCLGLLTKIEFESKFVHDRFGVVVFKYLEQLHVLAVVELNLENADGLFLVKGGGPVHVFLILQNWLLSSFIRGRSFHLRSRHLLGAIRICHDWVASVGSLSLLRRWSACVDVGRHKLLVESSVARSTLGSGKDPSSWRVLCSFWLDDALCAKR